MLTSCLRRLWQGTALAVLEPAAAFAGGARIDSPENNNADQIVCVTHTGDLVSLVNAYLRWPEVAAMALAAAARRAAVLAVYESFLVREHVL